MHRRSSHPLLGSAHPCSTTLPGVKGEAENHQSSSSSNTSNTSNMGGSRSSIGDIAFKSLTAALGLTTIYLTATFSVNVYRGLAWHNAQTKADKQEANDQN